MLSHFILTESVASSNTHQKGQVQGEANSILLQERLQFVARFRLTTAFSSCQLRSGIVFFAECKLLHAVRMRNESTVGRFLARQL